MQEVQNIIQPNIKLNNQKNNNNTLFKRIYKARYLYILFIPTIIYFFLFAYIPLWGLQIAFKDFAVFKGVAQSPWVGLKHFMFVFNSDRFYLVLKNTLIISLYKLVAEFPIPIIFAILLNEVKHLWFKKTIQTITYFPHFLSWVVFGGIIFRIIGPTGVLETMLKNNGMPSANLLTNPITFRSMLVATSVFKEFGWQSILYLAAITNISPELYEAAKIDGAGKIKQIWHITLTGIRPTIIILLILNVGQILNAGFDQIFILYNAAVYDVSDIIDTYVYRIGLLNGKYEIATAVGLFKGIVGMILILTANKIVKLIGERGLF